MQDVMTNGPIQVGFIVYDDFYYYSGLGGAYEVTPPPTSLVAMRLSLSGGTTTPTGASSGSVRTSGTLPGATKATSKSMQTSAASTPWAQPASLMSPSPPEVAATPLSARECLALTIFNSYR